MRFEKMASIASCLVWALAAGPVMAQDAPPGEPKSGKTKTLEAGAKLLQSKAEDLMASFTSLAEVLDPAEFSRLEETVAVAAAKRSELVWEGRLRTRSRPSRPSSSHASGAACTPTHAQPEHITRNVARVSHRPE